MDWEVESLSPLAGAIGKKKKRGGGGPSGLIGKASFVLGDDELTD